MTINKILIEYLYKEDKLVPYIDYTKLGPEAKINVIKGEPYGVVVAINASVMGWSLCNKADKFDKVKALELAIARAKIVSYIEHDCLEDFYASEVPFSLNDLILKMNARSIKYFK